MGIFIKTNSFDRKVKVKNSFEIIPEQVKAGVYICRIVYTMPGHVTQLGTKIVNIVRVHVTEAFGFVMFGSKRRSDGEKVDKVVANVRYYGTSVNGFRGVRVS
jgi:hypothetical protein